MLVFQNFTQVGKFDKGPGPRAGHSWFDHAMPTPPLLPFFSIPPIPPISPLRAEHPLERVTRILITPTLECSAHSSIMRLGGMNG